jgi:FixJ family two-component response regulator
VKTPDLPILYSSGYTDDDILRHGVIETNTNFIAKPFTAQALAIKVRAMIDESSSG